MLLDAVFVLLILTNLILLGSSLLSASIRIVAVQGAVLGVLPFLAMAPDRLGRVLFLAVLTVALKGGVFPWLLNRALREVHVRREVAPLVGYSVSLALGIGLLALAFWLGGRIRDIGLGVSVLSLSTALFMMFTGLFLVISRQKALSQVLGFLVLENGIYAFGLLVVVNIHWLIELGVLLDVFVAVFIMGVAIDQISRAFDHMDVDQMNHLKG
ncbi:MAG: hydrogenase [Verrucomicrobia bacterium]|nr:hydrogenase [Verrucomicrobiota bacterium]MBU4247644.1 hydrogenase [Verrucomicrobiota bacterium]MBU4292416.1 hydrogenase [Verrucomicrobiota bacterium]MBU4428403.1 hydrogenase [Verrucomicrobiota bacterium]MCG2680907.1 hydrogenase [Kiritimatiellia bacterium]